MLSAKSISKLVMPAGLMLPLKVVLLKKLLPTTLSQGELLLGSEVGVDEIVCLDHTNVFPKYKLTTP